MYDKKKKVIQAKLRLSLYKLKKKHIEVVFSILIRNVCPFFFLIYYNIYDQINEELQIYNELKYIGTSI